MHELEPCHVQVDGATLLVGYVREMVDGMLRIGSQDLIRGMEPGLDVVVVVLDEVRGECEYVGMVLRVSAGIVEIGEVELRSTLQKREVVRVRVAVECAGTAQRPWTPATAAAPGGAAAAVGPDAAPAGGQPSPETPLKFTVLDISAHGMRFLATEDLPLGTTVRFLYPELTRPFPLEARVVRVQESRTGTHYGCQFVGASPRETDVLFRYVLRTQGEQRRQQLAN